MSETCICKWKVKWFWKTKWETLYRRLTFTTISVTETDKNLAVLATTFHFPRPEERDLWVLVLIELLLDGRITTSKSHISTCSLGSLEIKPTPSLTKDWRKLSLISPTVTDSIAPYKLSKSKQDEDHNFIRHLSKAGIYMP